MTTYAYDIEVLKNLFTATFVNVDNPDDEHVFYIGMDRVSYSDLLTFLKQRMTLIGYNNHSYDDPILRFIMKYKGTSIVRDIFDLSGKLISEGYRDDKTIMELRYPKTYMYPWTSIDLMRILAFDKLGISLKQTAINLGWYKIQDMPVTSYTETIHPSQLQSILNYNLNDVLITKRLYEELKPIRELREELSKLYHVNLNSASDSKMANLILEDIYQNELHTDIRTIRTMRTYRENVLLGDCIAKFVKFQTPELQEMLDRISATVVYSYNNYRYSEKVYFANCKFALGIGGLHTEDAPGIFTSNEKYLIQDMDVSSYYPNLIINNKFYPAHLGEGFIRVLKKITSERLDAKKSGDKVKADGLKITINSIFGKLGSPTFWLLDAKQMLSTTISGQMGLLMLVEDLYLNGIHVISCNTDGIVCEIPRELMDTYYEVAHRWEKTTNLELEFTPYKKYVRRDVNSYITEKEDGSTKEKGAFLKEVDLKKAYHMPIVAKALYAYFIKDIPVKETLENCKDIMEFCLSQKTGSNFSLELHTPKGIIPLQKTNRYYVSKKGGSLIKKDYFSDRRIGLQVGRLVEILNDYDSYKPFEEYEVDLSFYEKEVMKIIDEIEPKQMTLFELSSLGRATITKMEVPGSKIDLPEKEMTVNELNKLGKNQFVKKIESIVEAHKVIEKISPRYVYVMNFDVKLLLVDVYCLSKGAVQTLSVDKKFYKKVPLETGQIVYCDKFEKTDEGYSLVEYKIVDKIKEEVQTLI